jgi:hypothetical protein
MFHILLSVFVFSYFRDSLLYFFPDRLSLERAGSVSDGFDEPFPSLTFPARGYLLFPPRGLLTTFRHSKILKIL